MFYIFIVMKIGDIKINGRVILAPLSGLTDSTFRLICRKMGAAIVNTEMICAEGIAKENTRTLRYLFFDRSEKPIAVQIYGDSPRIMAEAAKMLERFSPSFIDINFGCPVSKVVKKGAGSAILKDLVKMEKVARAVVENSSLPVTAKIRSGWSKNNIIAVDAAVMLEDCGIAAISIHPRTSKTEYSEPSDWNIIKDVKMAVKIPVIGNGDITGPVEAEKMFKETECDFIMIGRASIGNPWIFKRINYYLNEGVLFPEPSFEEKLEICLEHIRGAIKNNGEFYSTSYLKKHIQFYLKGIRGNHKIIKEIIGLYSAKEIELKVRNLLTKNK